jgi:hypothetical protein
MFESVRDLWNSNEKSFSSFFEENDNAFKSLRSKVSQEESKENKVSPDETNASTKDAQNQTEATLANTPVTNCLKETNTTTHIVRNADGSVYKETVVIEHLSDGSTKTTKIVNNEPAQGSKITETRIETTPPSILPKVSKSSKSSSPVQPGEEARRVNIEEPEVNAHRIQERVKEQTQSRDIPKGDDGKQRNWTWWFWSSK